MQWLAIVISIITIISTEFIVQKRWWSWLISFFNQVLWFILIVGTEQWGLLLLNFYMVVQSYRGARRWHREKRENANGKKEADMERSDGRLSEADEGDT